MRRLARRFILKSCGDTNCTKLLAPLVNMQLLVSISIHDGADRL